MASAIDIEKKAEAVMVQVEPVSPSSGSLSSLEQAETLGNVSRQACLQQEEEEGDGGDDDDGFQPPDGGIIAWCQVLTGFLLNAVAWGYPSMFGVYQAYYTETLGLPATHVSWVGSFQTFLTYFMCAVSGRLADAGYPRQTVFVGSVLVVSGTLFTSLAHSYWQIFLAQGLCTGIGLGLLTAASLTVISAYFRRRRSIALAASTTGTSAGSALFPAVVQYLIPQVGFPWAVRCSALVALVICVNALVLMRPRPVARSRRAGEPLVDWAAFREVPYVLFVLSSFLLFWALYFGFFYINIYSEEKLGFSASQAANLLILSTALGVPTRFLVGLLADCWLGAINAYTIAVFALGGSLYIWAAATDAAGMYAFVVTFGLANGLAQGIWAATLASLTRDRRRLGIRFGMACTTAACATLAGPPTAGALIQAAGGSYLWAQIWAGSVMVLGAVAMAAARVRLVGWSLRVKV